MFSLSFLSTVCRHLDNTHVNVKSHCVSRRMVWCCSGCGVVVVVVLWLWLWLWLWLRLWLWWCGGCGGCGSDEALTKMCFSIPPQPCTLSGWQNIWESDSWRPRHPEPSTTNNCWPSRAPSWTRRPDGWSTKNVVKIRRKRPQLHSIRAQSVPTSPYLPQRLPLARQ